MLIKQSLQINGFFRICDELRIAVMNWIYCSPNSKLFTELRAEVLRWDELQKASDNRIDNPGASPRKVLLD